MLKHEMIIHMRDGQQYRIGIVQENHELPGFAENIGLRGHYYNHGADAHHYIAPANIDWIEFLDRPEA